MDVPPLTNPRWEALLRGTHTAEIKFLGLRLMLGRLKAKVSSQPAALPEAIRELHTFFVVQHHLPSVQSDLQTIFR